MIFAVTCWGDKQASLLIDARTHHSALSLVARPEAVAPIAAAGYRFRAGRRRIRLASGAETAIWVEVKLQALRTSPYAPVIVLVAEPDKGLVLVVPLHVHARGATELWRGLRIRKRAWQTRIPTLVGIAQSARPSFLVALLALAAWAVLFCDLSLV
jgi:hypothetical protein